MSFYVRHERCDECLLGPNHITIPGRREAILRKCLRDDTHFECHKGTLRGKQLCCRGFFDQFEGVGQLLRIAGRLGAIKFVDDEHQEVADA